MREDDKSCLIEHQQLHLNRYLACIVVLNCVSLGPKLLLQVLDERIEIRVMVEKPEGRRNQNEERKESVCTSCY